eukprot:SAG11_NODE_33004_length_279_cov_1.355556_1_plen_93_part_11
MRTDSLVKSIVINRGHTNSSRSYSIEYSHLLSYLTRQPASSRNRWCQSFSASALQLKPTIFVLVAQLFGSGSHGCAMRLTYQRNHSSCHTGGL